MALIRKDPLPVFCFKFQAKFVGGNKADAFFKSVGGLKYETEIVPVREGGTNDTTFNLVGATKWSNIVLKQGFTGNSNMLTWREEWLHGTYNRAETGKIIQLNTAMKEMAVWTFYRGWPAKWEISEFDASKSETAIETLEIAHEGLTFEVGSGK